MRLVVHARVALVAAMLAGCALPAPPPSAPPPEVSMQNAAPLPTAALLDPYVGTYRRVGETVTVRRAGNQLIVSRSNGAPVVLVLVGLAAFADAAGNSYLFASGAERVTLVAVDGTRRVFAR